MRARGDSLAVYQVKAPKLVGRNFSPSGFTVKGRQFPPILRRRVER